MDAWSIGEILAVALPVLVLQLGLIVWAIVDLVRRDRVRGGSKLLWVIVIILFEFLGPIIYLVWGRNES